MNKNKFDSIESLINNDQTDKAQTELSKLGSEFFKDVDYLYLRKCLRIFLYLVLVFQNE